MSLADEEHDGAFIAMWIGSGEPKHVTGWAKGHQVSACFSHSGAQPGHAIIKQAHELVP
ncbi:MAG: hypothetical protein Rhims3KO_00900 [Hyphomicrobiales bacterium]